MQNISPKVQNLIAQYQELAQRIQTFSNQRMSMELQVREIERTIKQLNDSKDKDLVYRSVGSLLIQTDDKEGLLKELNEQLETFSVRVKSFENQEKQLKERYDSLQKQITQELGGAGGQDSQEN